MGNFTDLLVYAYKHKNHKIKKSPKALSLTNMLSYYSEPNYALRAENESIFIQNQIESMWKERGR